MTRLLVVDWDSFFVDLGGHVSPAAMYLYDWAHKETDFFINGPIWTTRAATFVANGLDLPTLSGAQATFWQRFRFAPGARLYTCESNAWAVHADVSAGVDDVWLFDAHHDSGYHARPEIIAPTWQGQVRAYAATGEWYCDDWMMVYAAMGAELHVRYPEWKSWAFEIEPTALLPDGEILDRSFDLGREVLPTFDRVLVCRSGAWVPPWHDRSFEKFLQRAPRALRRIELQATTRRDFDTGDVERQARALRAAHTNEIRLGGYRP